MSGTHYWEYKKYGQPTGMFNKETSDGPAATDFTANNRSRSENAGGSDWKGPGTLWIAESDDSQRKK